MQGFDCYIFSLVDTFADLRSGYESAYSHVFERFKMKYSREDVLVYADTPLEKLFEDYNTGCTCRYRDFVTMMIGEFYGNVVDKAEPYPGAVGTLLKLKDRGYRLGIVSCQYEDTVHAILSNVGAEGLFDSVVGQDRIPVPRPDPCALTLCMGELGAEKEKTAFVTSSPLDIETASNAGIQSILIDRTGTVSTGRKPSFRISSLDEL